MGWWPIDDVRHGGINWGGNWQCNCQHKLFMGDGPADIMNNVLDDVLSMQEGRHVMKRVLKKITKEYMEEFDRPPKVKELIACFNFCQVPKIFKKDWLKTIKNKKAQKKHKNRRLFHEKKTEPKKFIAIPPWPASNMK